MTKLIPQLAYNRTIFQRINAASNLFDILSLRGAAADYMEGVTHLWEMHLIPVEQATQCHNEVNDAYHAKFTLLTSLTLN